MGRTYRNDGYGCDREYWKSRLHRHGEQPGRFTKKRTHRKERYESYDEIEDLQEEINTKPADQQASRAA
jgi:hypothetical protein